MQQVICITAIAPIRLEPNHRSEMTNQLLLGEFAAVLQEQATFYQIACRGYEYIGWCQKSQLSFVDAVVETNCFIADAVATVYMNEMPVRVSMGTPVYKEGLQTKNLDIQYTNAPFLTTDNQSFTATRLMSLLNMYMNTPYVWGGRSVFGIDCSGLVQQVYCLLGVQLPRDAYQQAQLGTDIGFLEEAICGDLAFFDNEQGEITHVGILINSTTIIHAAAFVKKDAIDHFGITCLLTGNRTHRLRMIKRIVSFS